MRSKNLFAGTYAVAVMLATPIPASSQPSHLSFGLVRLGAAAVEEVRHRRYRYAHRRYDRPYYRPYNDPYYYYRPHYYDPGWSRGFNESERLLQCLLSQPFVSCG